MQVLWRVGGIGWPHHCGTTGGTETDRPAADSGPDEEVQVCSAQIPQDARLCMYCKRPCGGDAFGIGAFVVSMLIGAVFFFGFWLPGCIEMDKKHKEMEQRHKEFDKEWNKRR
jgi:hypothetical protein